MSAHASTRSGAVRAAVLAFAVLLAPACDDPPSPGTFEIVVKSAPAGAGGALVTISGSGLSRIAAGSVQLVSTDSAASDVTYVIRGDINVGDVLARISVDRVDREPVVTILQLAGNQAAGYVTMQPSLLVLAIRRTDP